MGSEAKFLLGQLNRVLGISDSEAGMTGCVPLGAVEVSDV